MEDLIKQAFVHVEVIGPYVQEGHYDLVGPGGEIILPVVWEKAVLPGWQITMRMWPLDNHPLDRQLPAHVTQMLPPPPYMRPQGTQMLDGAPPPPPGRPVFHPPGTIEVVDGDRPGRKMKAKKAKSTLGFFSPPSRAKPPKRSG